MTTTSCKWELILTENSSDVKTIVGIRLPPGVPKIATRPGNSRKVGAENVFGLVGADKNEIAPGKRPLSHFF